jgi:hypothetical protein
MRKGLFIGILMLFCIINAIAQNSIVDCFKWFEDRTNEAVDKRIKELDRIQSIYGATYKISSDPEEQAHFDRGVNAETDRIEKWYENEINRLDKEYDNCLNIQRQQREKKQKAQEQQAARKAQQEEQNRQIEERNREIRAKQAEQAEARRQAYLEAQRKEREKRVNEIVRPAQQNIDNFTRSATDAAYANKARGKELAGKSLLAEHNARNHGRDISVTSQMPSEYAMTMMKEEPAQAIGSYANQPVYKKGDTIIVVANNKKYLLSKQALMGGVSEVYAYTPESAFIISNDLQGGEMPIGYITTTSEKSNSTLYGEIERFAKSAVDCKFTEYICDIVVYEKFIKFCDWQICKMENSTNNSMIISNDLESKKEEYAELYAIIASQKRKDIVVNIAMDAGDFLWNNKYVKKLKDESVVSILGQNVRLNTSVNDYVSLLITDALTYPLSSDKLKIGGFSFKDIKDCILPSNIINVKGGNLKLGDLIKDGYRTEQTKKVEAELETEVARYFKQGRDMIDKCIPTDLKFKSKQVYLYYAVGKNLVEYGEMLGFMAASIKLTFFDNSSKKEYDAFTDNCRKKKILLEEYKAKYYNLIEKNKNNCLEYTKIINQLKSEAFNPFGNKNTQEVLNLMQDYVFGKKEIPQCKVLSFEELRPVERNTQPTKPADKSSTIIGCYGQIPVYKFNDSIVVNEKVYLLPLQPYQKNNNNTLTRYFIIYEGKNVTFSKPQEKPYENVKSFVGWVNYENNKYTFVQYNNDKVAGLNYFGSIYIGDNNPLNPNETPNFDIPAQDEIDEAAKQHDKCYDALNVEGKWGVVSPISRSCDDALSISCFSAIISNYNKEMLDNPSKFVEAVNLLELSKETISIACEKIIHGDNLFFDIEALRERALLTGFLFAGITNTKAILDAANKVMANYGEREIKKYDLLNEQKNKESVSSQKITYPAPATLISTSGEHFDAIEGDTFDGEMKEGKIVQGKVIRNGETVKMFLNKRNY